MKWHRIKTEADLPSIGKRVIFHSLIGTEQFDWAEIGSYEGKVYDDCYGFDVYEWNMDVDGRLTHTQGYLVFTHWAEIEMPPIAVLDGMSKEEYVAHTTEMGGVAEVAEMEAHG